MNEEVFYKIRRRRDGLFSMGGDCPRFNNKGKIWNGIGPLRNHLNGLMNTKTYDGCEIVKYVTKEIEAKSVADEIAASKDRKDKRNAEREERYQRAKVEEELKKLRELQSKYPDR